MGNPSLAFSISVYTIRHMSYFTCLNMQKQKSRTVKRFCCIWKPKVVCSSFIDVVLVLRHLTLGHSCCDSVVTNKAGIHEDKVSIPGLTLWIKYAVLPRATVWGHRCGSDPALLWFAGRPAATALIQPLAWELPYAPGVALNKQTKTHWRRSSWKGAIFEAVFSWVLSSGSETQVLENFTAPWALCSQWFPCPLVLQEWCRGRSSWRLDPWKVCVTDKEHQAFIRRLQENLLNFCPKGKDYLSRMFTIQTSFQKIVHEKNQKTC